MNKLVVNILQGSAVAQTTLGNVVCALYCTVLRTVHVHILQLLNSYILCMCVKN